MYIYFDNKAKIVGSILRTERMTHISNACERKDSLPIPQAPIPSSPTVRTKKVESVFGHFAEGKVSAPIASAPTPSMAPASLAPASMVASPAASPPLCVPVSGDASLSFRLLLGLQLPLALLCSPVPRFWAAVSLAICFSI